MAAYTSVSQADLIFTSQESLQWYHDESPNTYRGFCNRCGASLFWDARNGNQRIAVAAGSLDDSGALKTVGHVYVAEAASYYALDDDLPQFQYSNQGALETGGGG